MPILKKLRKKIVLAESKAFPSRFVKSRLFFSPDRFSEVLLRRRRIIGKGDFENVVFAVDALKGKRVLRFVEKVYAHSDAKAVWFDMKILADLKKSGCRVPNTVRVRNGRMPSLILSDLRFADKEKTRITNLGAKIKINNFDELEKDVISQAKKAASIGYGLRVDAFLVSVDKKGIAKAFVVDVDHVSDPEKKADAEKIMDHFLGFFRELREMNESLFLKKADF